MDLIRESYIKVDETPEGNHWIDCELEECARCDAYDELEGHFGPYDDYDYHDPITVQSVINDYIPLEDAVARMFTDDDRRINLWYKMMIPAVNTVSIETEFDDDIHGYIGATSYGRVIGYRFTWHNADGSIKEQFRVDDYREYYVQDIDPETDKPVGTNFHELYVLSSFPAGLPYWLFPTFQDIYALERRFDIEQAKAKAKEEDRKFRENSVEIDGVWYRKDLVEGA